MKRTGQFMSYLSAFLSGLTLFEPKSAVMVLLMLPKMLAAGLAPFVALAGGLGALLSFLRRDWRAMLAGLVGAAIMTRHIRNVTAPHDGFEQAFGPDWRARILPALRARMLDVRWPILLPETPGVAFRQNVVFGTWPEDGEPLLCDIWEPPSGVPRTGLAVVYLHGSGWHYLDKDAGTRTFFRHLAGQGHVIMDVAYTLAPKADLFGMIGDVKRAIAWMKVNAAQYGVDPERIVLIGGSAGGHLALLAAYAPDHPELQAPDVTIDTAVRAVVSYYGPPDLRAFHEYLQTELAALWEDLGDQAMPLMTWLSDLAMSFLVRGDKSVSTDPRGLLAMVSGLLRGMPDDVPELYALGSPINHVGPHCPPTLLLQGEHDVGIKPETVRRLHNALRAAGVPSIYVEFPSSDHGFDLTFPKWSPAAQAATFDVERFLALMV